MKTLLSIIFIFVFSSAGFGQSGLPMNSTSDTTYFIVDSTTDSNDADTTNSFCADSAGRCTLRAAVQQANAAAGNYNIKFYLPTPAIINLTLGQIRIESNITINGLGARNLVVDGGGRSRVFGVYGNAAAIQCEINALTVAGGNSGTAGGGGIYISPQNTLVIVDAVIRNNKAAGGGGIFNRGYLFITQSTISNNSSINRGSGGGIITDGSANIANSTITNNSAGYGGGIAVAGSETTLNNDTITDNSVTEAGGGVINYQSTVSIRNTIVARNTSPIDPDVSGDTYNSFNSLGNNLIGAAAYGLGFYDRSNADKVGTLPASIDPKLGELQNNGGQTDTRALLAGSPALDGGNNCVRTSCPSNNPWTVLLNDQRGTAFTRFVGAVDIGAFEKQRDCVYTLNQTSQDFTAAGGRGTFTGTTQSSCSIAQFASDSFIAHYSTTGSNSETEILSFSVSFIVAANAGAARTGTINFGGQTFTVNQAAADKSRKRIRFL